MNHKCHQRIIKEDNFQDDFHSKGFKYLNDRNHIKVSNLKFHVISKKEKNLIKLCDEFIRTNEYLRKNIARPTNRFVALYKNEIAGVVIMGPPYSISNLLGKENIHSEKLIGRGASAPWAPKEIGTWMISKATDYMVNNTQARAFIAYCDPRALEIGKIYQGCNFMYMGNHFGARREYFDPKTPSRQWFSSRVFRRVGTYKRIAKQNGIVWEDSWVKGYSIVWDNIPPETTIKLKELVKEYIASCFVRIPPKKHKYVMIKGRNKRETKQLLQLFAKNNPKLVQSNGKLGLPYPQKRGV